MKKKWHTSWAKLTRDEQDRYLTILWQDGYTEQAIADFFKGATKGRIVRRRQTGLHLSSEGRGKVKKVVEYDRFLDLLDIDKMDELEEKNAGNVVCIAPTEDARHEPERRTEEPEESEPPPPAPASKPQQRTSRPDREQGGDVQRTASRRKPKYQIALDWRLQCVHRDENNLQCSYEKEPDSNYCKLHK